MVGKPQTLSKGQKEEVRRILWKQVVTGFLIGLAVLTGLTGLSLWEIARRVENNMERLVAKQFEEPRIQKVVRKVAADRADTIMHEQIQPEVQRFKGQIDKQLDELQTSVDEATRLAAPPSLSLSHKKITKSDGSLIARLQFRPSKNVHLGTITFRVRVLEESTARILDFWPDAKYHAFTTGDKMKQIDTDGKKATLSFSLMGAGSPTVDITLSGQARVAVAGNLLAEEIVVNVELSAEQPASRDGA